MPFRRTNLLRLTTLAALGLLAAACGESGQGDAFSGTPNTYCDNPDAAAPSCDLTGYSMQDDSALAAKLAGCAVGGCHLSPAATSWTMDLSGSVEAALSALTVPGGTGGYFLVDDADPDCSLLLSEVTPLPSAGVRMPVTGSFWSSAETDCFRSYLHELSN